MKFVGVLCMLVACVVGTPVPQAAGQEQLFATLPANLQQEFAGSPLDPNTGFPSIDTLMQMPVPIIYDVMREAARRSAEANGPGDAQATRCLASVNELTNGDIPSEQRQPELEKCLADVPVHVNVKLCWFEVVECVDDWYGSGGYDGDWLNCPEDPYVFDSSPIFSDVGNLASFYQ